MAQVKIVEPKRQVVSKKKITTKARLTTLNPTNIIFGSYEVTKYSALSTKTLPSNELKALIGSIIKVQETAITGTEIDPFHFEIFDIEEMNSSDYIFREFGRSIRAPEPNLPSIIKVHKTDFEGCYGIVEISENEITIPYNGVLLFLKRS